MKNCYVCNAELTSDNKTEEHIIPNSIGGKLKSVKLLCKNCNSTLGHTLDTEIYNTLKIFVTLINVKRDRNKPKPIDIQTESGEFLSLESEGKITIKKPLIKITPEFDKVNLEIRARDIKQLKQILNGLKRTYPKLDVEEFLQKYVPITINEELSGKQKINMGGIKSEDFYRGVAKIAVNFALKNNINKKIIKEIIKYVIEGKEIRKFVEFYYEKDKIVDYPQNSLNHILLLIGNHENKKLYCYIELFNCFKLVVLLSEDYRNESFNKTYFYNIKEKNIKNYYFSEVSLDYFTKSFYYKDIYDFFNQYVGELNITLNNIIHQRNLNYIIEKNIKKHFSKDREVTEEMIKDFSGEFINEILAKKIYQIKRND